MRRLVFLFISSLSALAGCQVAAPRPQQEVAQLPGSYRPGAAAPLDSTSIGDLPVRQFFADSTLVALIDTALGRNLDLRQAVQRVEQARAGWLNSRAPLLPSVSAGAAAGLDHYGQYTLNGVGNYDTNLSPNIRDARRIPTSITPDYFVGLRSSWEVDLWGRLRSRRRAAYSRLLASEQGRNLVVTNLVAEVARNYYELLKLDNQLTTLQRNTDLQQRSLEIMKVQKQAGSITELAVQQFAAQVLRTRSLAFEVRQRIAETENQLNQLLGRYPKPVARPTDLLDVPAPAQLAAGLPSRLLLRRPDVREAELNLTAAGADFDAARAAFLPALTLTPYAGVQAFRTSLLFEPGSVVYGVLAGMAAPVFNRRALKAEYQRSLAANLEQYYAYQKALQTSVREVSNGLQGLENYRATAELRRQEVAVLRQAVATATDLQVAGYASYLEIITAQRTVLDAELSLAELHQAQLLQAVVLYRALGGGWNAQPALVQ